MHLFFEQIITKRTESCFKQDIEDNFNALKDIVQGSRIAIIGGAGSIGSAVVKTILRFSPAGIVIFDLSENNLVELVRDLRSSKDVKIPQDFSTLPIGMGTIEFSRYFEENRPFDYFFNLAAMKHVRSEKDIYCIMRMLDTNVIFLHDFLTKNPYKFKKVFSVSSDKATNPANLMGATKMAMEQALLYRSEIQPFSTARFANVAFSDGSLPYGFLKRIEKRQPISAPCDIRRYFISHQEAGELCSLSAFLGENRDVFFPKFEKSKDEKTFSEIAIELLRAMNYEPFICDSEEEAKNKAEELIKQKKWPCYLFNSNTDGEKDYEEFYSDNEELDLLKFKSVGIIKRGSEMNREAFEKFLEFAKFAKTDKNITKGDYLRELQLLIPGFNHVSTGKNLDEKM